MSENETNDQDQTIENFLAAAIGAAMDEYQTHMPEYVVFNTIQRMHAGFKAALEARKIDPTYSQEVVISCPHPL